jgi:voltage-gated potassium channel
VGLPISDLEIAAYHLGSFHGGLSRLDAVYRAVTTFTTVGSGDLYPIGAAARAAVTAETVLAVSMLGVGLSIVLSRFRR